MHHKSKIAVIIIKTYNQSKQVENIIKMVLCLDDYIFDLPEYLPLYKD